MDKTNENKEAKKRFLVWKIHAFIVLLLDKKTCRLYNYNR